MQGPRRHGVPVGIVSPIARQGAGTLWWCRERGCRAQGDEEGGEDTRQGGADALQFHLSSPVESMTCSFERPHDVACPGTGIARLRRFLVSKGLDENGSWRVTLISRGAELSREQAST